LVRCSVIILRVAESGGNAKEEVALGRGRQHFPLGLRLSKQRAGRARQSVVSPAPEGIGLHSRVVFCDYVFTSGRAYGGLKTLRHIRAAS